MEKVQIDADLGNPTNRERVKHLLCKIWLLDEKDIDDHKLKVTSNSYTEFILKIVFDYCEIGQ